MLTWELGSTAQHWFNAILIWVGFGTVAGLLARTLIPARDVGGAAVVVTLGIIGSVIGPVGLSYLFRDRILNPLGPLGLLAATAGAFVLLAIYRLVVRPASAAETEDEDAER
jgi:uncharacterized membrane protein YeaQ/YmgE (transglycosylase-associated protein family)